MNDQDLEQQIRKLRPGPLPPELRSRLREEPPIDLPSRRRHLGRWAMAAAVVGAAILGVMIFPDKPSKQVAVEDGTTNELAVEDHEAFTVIQQEATLIGTRTLERREHDGRLWELVEQQWRDETVAVCSATPVRVRATVIRPETVWVPVKFQ